MFRGWGYKRAFGRCALLLAAGVALQTFSGSIDPSFLRYPWGVIVALVYVYLLLAVHLLGDKWPKLRRLSDTYASLSSLTMILVLLLVFGLVRQDGRPDSFLGFLGFTRMSRSWVFAVPLLYFTTVVTLTAIDEIHHFNKHRFGTVFAHIGLSVILISGTFGCGDFKRVTLTAPVGIPRHTALTDSGAPFALPFEVTLKRFEMDEYPPKLFVYDIRDGSFSDEYVSCSAEPNSSVSDGQRSVPVRNHSSDSIHTSGSETVPAAITVSGAIGEWSVVIKDYIASAGKDSLGYVPLDHFGAVPAAFVSVAHSSLSSSSFTGTEADHIGKPALESIMVEDWVSCRSSLFGECVLKLDDYHVLRMSKPEPKRFASEVVLERSGQSKTVSIEVNHPAKVGAWRIYQSGYDTEKGKWSSYSVLECVRDPWFGAVRIALWLLLLSGAGLVCFGGKKK